MMKIASQLLLEPAVMNAADKAGAEAGINMWQMMVNAGSAVAASALRHFPDTRRFVVLCGPGNNGGDGYVAARYLRDSGAVVGVYTYGNVPAAGDALKARELWGRETGVVDDYAIDNGDTVIDALFGAGLARPLDDGLCALIAAIQSANLPVISADIPSGVDGRTGRLPHGANANTRAFKASHTVTFICAKPGHLLLPGREHCGQLEIVDIGIPERIIGRFDQKLRINTPALWQGLLPRHISKRP